MLNTALWIPYYVAIALAFLAFLGFMVSLFHVTQEKARRPERAPAIVEWNPVNAIFFTDKLTAYGLRVRRRIAVFGLCTLGFVGLAFCCLLVLKLVGE
jgi:hypothetical protein